MGLPKSAVDDQGLLLFGERGAHCRVYRGVLLVDWSFDVEFGVRGGLLSWRAAQLDFLLLLLWDGCDITRRDVVARTVLLGKVGADDGRSPVLRLRGMPNSISIDVTLPLHRMGEYAGLGQGWILFFYAGHVLIHDRKRLLA